MRGTRWGSPSPPQPIWRLSSADSPASPASPIGGKYRLYVEAVSECVESIVAFARDNGLRIDIVGYPEAEPRGCLRQADGAEPGGARGGEGGAEEGRRRGMTDGSPLDALAKALYIAWKDARVYYFKAPNFTYGLLMPVSLFLAFSLAGEMDARLVVSGLPALAVLFGTTSIEAVAIVLEKQTGTFDRLLAAPVSFLTIMVGKALSGFFFGTALGVVVLAPVPLLAGVPVASPLLAVVAIGFSSLCFAALGVLVSAYANWVPEAQMVSNLIRFPDDVPGWGVHPV